MRRATGTISRTFRIKSSSTRKFSTHDCTSSDVSGGADLVRQLLHSRFVGAVEEFSVGQEIRPVRGVKQVKSGGGVVAPMVGALGYRLLRSVFLPRLTTLRMQAKAATMTSAACALSHEHACRTKAARGICGTAVLHAAALARRMRPDKANGSTRASGAAAAQVDSRTPPSCRECTLAMPQHSRPINSRARSSVAVGVVGAVVAVGVDAATSATTW